MAGLLAWAAVLCGAVLSLAESPVPRSTRAPSQATGHVLVQFDLEAVSWISAFPAPDRLGRLTLGLGLPPGATLVEPPIARLLDARGLKARDGVPAEPDLGRFLYLELPRGMTVAECLWRLERHPWLEYAEPDFVGHTKETLPNDPDFPAQWHHQNADKPKASIQTPLAWDITQGSTNVLVAVLDTGLAEDLPEFRGRVVPGYNFAYTNEITLDDNGHGTQVTGVLAANANNGVLGAGVDWHCRIMPIKVFDASNQGLYSAWAQGIDYALSNGCKVINLSGAGTDFSRTVQRSITNAIARGAIFVTAAGNNGTSTLGFPGYLAACITVGATDDQDRRALFSNYGAQLDLVAPGQDLLTVGGLGSLEVVRGTSFSAPLVAGVCSLLASLRPGLTQAEARLFLGAGADDQVGGETDLPGFDEYHGWGRLNAHQTLQLAATRIDSWSLTPAGFELRWAAALNAGLRRPYQVEWKAGIADDWLSLTNTNAFHYEPGRVRWVDDGSQTSRDRGSGYYRIALRSF